LTESDSPDNQPEIPNSSTESAAQLPPPSTPPLSPADRARQRLKEFGQSMLNSFNIGHLLLILLALHIFAMSFPNQTSPSPQYVFDEAYYVPAALDLLHLVPSNLEHPFFGKVWGALGIYLFGNDFFGWRIFYVIIGTAAVGVFYAVARFFFSKEKALLAASFLGFETLFFIHTSLALLEGPPIFFMLIGFYAYFKKHYYWAAFAFGLSVLSKEWGTYFLIALFIYHVWATRFKAISPEGIKKVVVFCVILIAVVGAPLTAYDQVYHPYENTIANVQTIVSQGPNGTQTTTNTTTYTHSEYVNYFWQNFEYYYSYHTALTMQPSDYSTPWQKLAWYWVLPLDVNPAQYYVTTVTITTTSSNGTVINKTYEHPIDWLGIGNLVIWLSFWIIVPVIVFKCIRKMATQLDILIGALIVGTYGPNLFLSGFYHRVVYTFYFVNTDPALALGIPMVIAFISPDSRNLQRILAAVWLGAAIVFFFLFFPIHPSGSLQG
jgi:dolichyl-phosphate-mannose--protein O-mannosyl transferase